MTIANVFSDFEVVSTTAGAALDGPAAHAQGNFALVARTSHV